jgi:chromate transporter
VQINLLPFTASRSSGHLPLFSAKIARMNMYLDIFLTFARVGALTFGGGYAMLPILQREVVDNRHWVSEAEVMNYYAVSQCLPGLIAVNTAIFIGNRIKKSRGGLLAALGVVFPSLVIITLIAAFISGFADLPLVQNAFAGVRACVFVLILNSILKLRKGSVVDLFSLGICVAIFLLSVLTDLNPILFIVAAGLAGALYRQNVREAKR